MKLRDILLIFWGIVGCILGKTIETDDYIIWTIPDPAVDVSGMKTESGVAMIGGGADCYPAFSWLIDHANGGDFVVMRVGGTDAYNPFVYDVSVTLNKPLNSVTTISWKNRDASFSEEVLTLLRNAEVIFFSGGDQGKYVEYWMDTPVQSIVQDKMMNGVSIGGTSAGLAIQGEYIFTAVNGSAYSDDCLMDPYNIFMTISGPFVRIPFLENTITDTHFGARERMGRMLTFLARLAKGDALADQKNIDPKLYRAIGMDETTAFLLDINTGRAQVVGQGNGYLCFPSGKPEICESDVKLTFKNINCIRLSSSTHDSFNFADFKGDGVSYANNIIEGKYASQPYGP